MKIRYFERVVAIGIIILFVGAFVGPNISAKQANEKPNISLTDKIAKPLFEGSSYFIMLNDYTDGAGQENHWSIQMRFDSALMVVEYEFDAAQLPLVLDQWTEIRVDIDLDGDWHEVYYNGDFLYEKEWTAGPNNDMAGIRNIGAIDLFANAASSVFYDDLSLEQVGTGIVWSENFDSYADGSSMHGQGGWKGWDNDPVGTAYVSSAYSQSTPQSVDIKDSSDLVHEYSGYTTGQYIFTAWIYIPSGNPPEAPVIDGPITGGINTPHDYTFAATHPDGLDIAEFSVDWGDGSTDTLTGPFASGEETTATHTWTTQGTYVITAKAKDVNGLEGPEGTLEVTMPKTRTVQMPLLIRFLQNHPNLFPILRQLLNL